MPTDLDVPRVQVQDLYDFCLAAMLSAGLSPEDARLTAEVLVTTDTWGVFTHGSHQLRGLLKNVRAGRLDPKATIEVTAEDLAPGGGYILAAVHCIQPDVPP